MPGQCGRDLELINLGRCLQDPKCLQEFTPDDWNDDELRDIFISLTTLPTVEQKREALSRFLALRGVDYRWVEYGKTAADACTESQKLNTLEIELAHNALLLVEDLQSRRFMGDKTAMLSAIDRLKEILGE